MESFFLAETTKYLYLLFDSDNFMHTDGVKGGRIIRGEEGKCVIEGERGREGEGFRVDKKHSVNDL